MESYTKIPNEIFKEGKLSVKAKYLYQLLLRFCGKKDFCYPGQDRIAGSMGFKGRGRVRSVRKYLRELEGKGIIKIRRRGFNRTNTYFVTKSLGLNKDGNFYSSHMGSEIPFHGVVEEPTEKKKRKIKNENQGGFEKVRDSARKIWPEKYT